MLKYVKRFLIVLLGIGISSALNFLTQTSIGKNLTVKDYGDFIYQLTILNLLAPCVGIGVSSFWLKSFGESEELAKAWMPATVKLISFTVIFILFVLVFYSIFDKSLNTYLFLIFSLYILGQASVEFSSSMYQIKSNYLAFSFVQSISHILRFFILLIIFYIGYESLDVVIYVYSIVGVFILTLLLPALKKFTKTDFTITGEYRVKDLFLKSLPFFGTGVFYLLYLQSAVVLIKFFLGSETVGLYAAAFLFLSSTYILPGIIYQRLLLPKLHQWAYHDKDKIDKVYKIGLAAMTTLGVIVFLFLYFSAENLILFFYGENYIEAIPILRLLSLAVIFKFLASSVGAILSTKNSIYAKFKILAIACAFNISLNLILIYFFGLYGAAIATIVTEFFIMIVMSLYYKYKYRADL